MGGMLIPIDLQHGARGIGKAKSGVAGGNSTPTLPEIGITKKENSQAQFLVSIRWQAVSHHDLELCLIVLRTYGNFLTVRSRTEFDS